MARTFIIVLAVLLQTATDASTQQPAAARSPSSIVFGRVVDDTTSSPIVRARISVPSGTANTPPAFTDADGRFSLAMPAMGGLRLRIAKSGFIARDITAATSADFIDVALTRGAVVTGRVLADDGEPLAGSAVRIQRAGVPLSQTAITESTADDLGEFRVASLAPGRYVLSAGNQAMSCISAASSAALSQCLRVRTEQEVELRAGEESAVLLTLPSPFTPSFARPSGSTVSAVIDASGVVSSFKVAPDPNGEMRGGVRGRVFATGSPTHGITVVLSGSPNTAAGERRATASAITDSDGRFAIERVPAGTFLLSATRSGMSLATSIVGSPYSNTIVIGDGERLNDVDVSIVRHGAISGTVVDEAGEPMEGLVIRAFRARYVSGRMVLEAAPAVRARQTDDRGQYRLYGFVPGSYYVVATQSASPIVPGGTPLHASLRVFYPGRTAAAEGVPIRVEAEAVIAGVDMAYTPFRGGRITGGAQLSSGRPVTGTAVLTGSSRSGGIVAEPRAAAIRNGQFEFAHVPSGDYVVQVMGSRTWESSEEFGTGYVALSGEGSTPLDITTAPPSTLSGTIRLEGASSAITPESFRLRTLPADLDLSPALPAAEPALSERVQVQSDGRFTIAGLIGSRRLVTSAPPGWWLKSAVVDGVDLANEPFLFGTGTFRRTGIDVVFADGAGTIAGRVSSSSGEPVAGHPVLVFPTDPARVYDQSPYLQMTHSDREGRYAVSNLPPGQYSVVAVGALIESDDWQHPDTLNRLAVTASRIVLGRGERAVVALRPTSLP